MISQGFIFGTWQIGGLPSFHNVDESEALSMLEYAYSLGIRSFDTAPIYGLGKSERLLGKAFESFWKEVRIITKFGYSVDKNGSHYDVTPKGIESQLQESLERLKTNCIDTYLLHIPERIESPESIIETLNILKRKGYIRKYGLCNTSGTLLSRFQSIKDAEISTVQDFYNLINRSIEQSIFPFLRENTEFMAYSPLYRGGLSETSLSEILKKDESALSMLFRNQGLRSFVRDRKLYEIVAEKRGISLKEYALEFLVNNPKVSSIIYGASQKVHLDEVYSLFQKLRK